MFHVKPRGAGRVSKYYPVAGGLDQVTPSLKKGPGVFEGVKNYEMDVNGGAQRVVGYERYDGQASPSGASYWVLGFDSGGTSTPAVDDKITGQTSGAFAYILQINLTSGSWAGGDAAGTFVLGRLTGTFQDNELLDTDAPVTNIATVDGTATQDGATPDATHYAYQDLAIEDQRAQIGAITGSGNILGVHVYNATLYAWRNNTGGTAAQLWKATSSGWVLQDLGKKISYTSGGTYQVQENDVITGATSGATAIVKRVILDSGTWSGGDAAGRFIIYSQTGTFQSETLDVGANTNVATIAGDSTAQTLAASGRVEAINTNFFGSSGTIRMYWVDGVSKAYEWDGSTAVELTTGMTTDTPNHIAEHRNYLFLSFPGGSVQNSDVGDPYHYTVRGGSTEFGTSDETTALKSTLGGVLVIFDRNRTWVLYGTAPASWELRDYSDRSGCIEWSMQEIWEPIYVDDRGITLLSAVQAYGDFEMNTVSRKARDLINAKKNLITASVVSKDLNRVRWFCSDNTGFTITIDKGKILGITEMDWGKPVNCACRGEDASGNEIIFFGADDGYVYQMEKGHSFDGSAIEAWMQLAFWHYGSPRVVKRFRRIVIDMTATRSTTLSVRPDFDFGDSSLGEPSAVAVSGGGGTWDVSNWDAFTWDTATVDQPGLSVGGLAVNMGLVIYSNASVPTHTIQGVLTDYTQRAFRYGA